MGAVVAHVQNMRSPPKSFRERCETDGGDCLCRTLRFRSRPADRQDRAVWMISILGIVIVLAAIVGGFLMEHGQLLVLLQPAELVIIVGAAVGTVIAANPLPALIRLAKGMAGVV